MGHLNRRVTSAIVGALLVPGVVAGAATGSPSPHIKVVSLTKSSYPNFTRLEVDCPAGYHLTGGGAEALGSDSILNTSIPNATATGWIAVGHQPGLDSVGLHVFAVCRKYDPAAARNIKVVGITKPSYPNFTRLEVDCPPGYHMTGGGAEALGEHSVLNTSIPNASGTGWIAVGHQPGFDSVGLHVFAVCHSNT